MGVKASRSLSYMKRTAAAVFSLKGNTDGNPAYEHLSATMGTAGTGQDVDWRQTQGRCTQRGGTAAVGTSFLAGALMEANAWGVSHSGMKLV